MATPHPGRRDRRGARGASAVEAALVISLLLFPLLMGVLAWGDYFWRAQRIDTLAPAVPEGDVAGTFSCRALQDEVASTVVSVVNGLHPEIGDIDLSEVVVTLLEVSPDVGVTVAIHIEVGAVNGLASLIPLPGGGGLVTDFTQRLDDVRLSDQACR